MNTTRENVHTPIAAFRSVTDDELAQIDGGFMNGMSLPLIAVKILEMFRTPPTVPDRTPPSPG